MVAAALELSAALAALVAAEAAVVLRRWLRRGLRLRGLMERSLLAWVAA